MMDRNQMREVIARRAALELKDGDVVNLGIGIPTAIPSYLPEGVNVTLQSENGLVGMGPAPEEGKEDKIILMPEVVISPILPVHMLVPQPIHSLSSERSRRCDFPRCNAGGRKGNLVNWMIPQENSRGWRYGPYCRCNHVIVTMEHTARGNHKIMKKCTLPLTAAGQVNMIITEMG